MPHFTVSQIFTFDKVNQAKVTQLLEDASIKRDANLDYTCGIFEEDGTLIATGSLFVNTLRCFAVCKRYTGEGLLNQIITHLISVQFERGNTHLFVYTKPESSKFFKDLGFYPIAEIPNLVTFMENRRAGFSDYLKKLVADDNRNNTDAAAIVMNANPFTLGHLHLIEKAARENQVVHLFLVSEDTSLVPFEVRKALILAGTSHLTNIIYHETGSYIISQSTFPSYFQKDSESIIKSQAEVDLSIFTKIAKTLGITKRYVGEEPNSLVTNIYNQAMQEKLPQMGIDCIVIPRLSIDGEIVSASTVRQLIKEDNLEAIKKFVPESTYQYFKSSQASEIIRNIQHETNVIHY
ncbi:[citrate (pro-3S)-lyase] ligase [Streptococcus parauberis]|uniref:[citrate (pro-3S)-lyase] ligase n=1 Tax=Streptococcus parauberis TaxID=1348 RepID=UPI0037A6DCEE